ncbi:MAG: right-handed parallel beta-helix repeat-containing protein [Cytophagaceae bacterium]|nr:right-handed parallel beta-helix repeat-containing protein [Gemmatimonadaceae bacterium]
MTMRTRELWLLMGVLACSGSSTVVVPATPSTATVAPAPAPPSVSPTPAPTRAVTTDSQPRRVLTPTVQAQVAELPRTRPVVPEGLDAKPCTVRVGRNLQGALSDARGGDVLCLPRGARYVGNFSIPVRPDTGFVVLRTDPSVELGSGRMRPSTSGQLARLSSATTSSTLKFLPRSGQWHVLGVEITSDSTVPQGPVALVEVGTLVERELGALPTDISFDRVYVHGWPQQHVRRAFAMNGGAFTLTRSWCDEIHATGYDSQCVISWGGSGPMLIEDNYLAAASENLMFGGGDPKIPGLVPSDITIRRNHVTKPLTWKGQKWNVKNLIETKSSARVLVEENVIEGVWIEGQTGYAFVLKSTTQGGTCAPCSSSDWTIRRNLVRNVGAGFSFAGRADQRPGSVTDSTVRRFQVTDNWIGPLNMGHYTGDARPLIFVAENHDIVFSRNVFEFSERVREALLFDISSGTRIAVRNLTMANNVFPKGQYGVGASAIGEGLRAWQVGATGRSTWGRNAFLGNSTVAYPPGTTWHGNMAQALGAVGISRAALDRAVAGVVVER